MSPSERKMSPSKLVHMSLHTWLKTQMVPPTPALLIVLFPAIHLSSIVFANHYPVSPKPLFQARAPNSIGKPNSWGAISMC